MQPAGSRPAGVAIRLQQPGGRTMSTLFHKFGDELQGHGWGQAFLPVRGRKANWKHQKSQPSTGKNTRHYQRKIR